MIRTAQGHKAPSNSSSIIRVISSVQADFKSSTGKLTWEQVMLRIELARSTLRRASTRPSRALEDCHSRAATMKWRLRIFVSMTHHHHAESDTTRQGKEERSEEFAEEFILVLFLKGCWPCYSCGRGRWVCQHLFQDLLTSHLVDLLPFQMQAIPCSCRCACNILWLLKDCHQRESLSCPVGPSNDAASHTGCNCTTLTWKSSTFKILGFRMVVAPPRVDFCRFATLKINNISATRDWNPIEFPSGDSCLWLTTPKPCFTNRSTMVPNRTGQCLAMLGSAYFWVDFSPSASWVYSIRWEGLVCSHLQLFHCNAVALVFACWLLAQHGNLQTKPKDQTKHSCRRMQEKDKLKTEKLM